LSRGELATSALEMMLIANIIRSKLEEEPDIISSPPADPRDENETAATRS